LPARSQVTVKQHLGAGTVAAKVFSNLFTPFSVAAIVSVVFSWFSPIGIGPLMTPLSSALTGILTLSVLPFVPVVYSARTGRTDLDVSDVRQRGPLYLPGLASYVAGAAIFLILNNKVMFVISFAYICVASVTFLITFAWKISTHTAGIAGPSTALVFVFGAQLLPVYLLSVLMVWSRVKLGAHTPRQAIAGLIVAVAITALLYTLLSF